MEGGYFKSNIRLNVFGASSRIKPGEKMKPLNLKGGYRIWKF